MKRCTFEQICALGLLSSFTGVGKFTEEALLLAVLNKDPESANANSAY